MYRYLFLLGLVLLCSLDLNAQQRSEPESIYAPFYHGVASGDPTHESVIIWTRVTRSTITSATNVSWEVATDTGMSNVIASGVAVADPLHDYTVKVDVTGLPANSWLYYQFTHDGRTSLVGRTRTMPTPGDSINRLRIGVVSCSNYAWGFFNAYRTLAERNDVDLILHLGDYIYENDYEPLYDSTRTHVPPKETVELIDYRQRHSQYKLEEDCRLLHQMYPMIAVWDDHESSNNSFETGADNHDPVSEGDWFVRKSGAIKAYYEWMPLRMPDPQDEERIYRDFVYGDLVDLIMLDTRLEGRDEQLSSGTSSGLNDTSRTILGVEQRNWFKNELSGANSLWKVIGQQVMVAPMEIFSVPLNMDQWDGYPDDRREIFNHIEDNQIDNVVFLTGDIHSHWANDLPSEQNSYDASTGNGSVAVEFVTTSVSSPGLDVLSGVAGGVLTLSNPHIKYVNLDRRGFSILDIDRTRIQNDFYYSVIDQKDPNPTYAESWYANLGENHIQQAGGESTSPTNLPIIPPLVPDNDPLPTSVETPQNFTMLGAYPNPFEDMVGYQFYLHEEAEVHIAIYNVQGELVANRFLGSQNPGMIEGGFQTHFIPTGTYFLSVSAGEQVVSVKIIKR